MTNTEKVLAWGGGILAVGVGIWLVLKKINPTTSPTSTSTTSTTLPAPTGLNVTFGSSTDGGKTIPGVATCNPVTGATTYNFTINGQVFRSSTPLAYFTVPPNTAVSATVQACE